MTKHLHIFERLRGKGGTHIRYKCLSPVCNSIHLAVTLEGKKALCSICKQKEIIISKDDLRRKHFRCLECSNRVEDKKKLEATIYTKNVLEGLFE